MPILYTCKNFKLWCHNLHNVTILDTVHAVIALVGQGMGGHTFGVNVETVSVCNMAVLRHRTHSTLRLELGKLKF